MSEIIDKPTTLQRIVRFIIAMTVLAAGVAVFMALVMTKPKPKKVAREHLGELVEVIEVKTRSQRVQVKANGQVIPAKAVAISAEVGGRVVWMNDKLIPGGRIPSGSKLVRIDGRDYRLALEQQRSMVNSAQTALEVERSRKEIAVKEWQIMGGNKPAEGTLALRDPQLKSAQAAVKAARSGFQRAQLAAGKTLVKAPFNAIVQQKNADIGQLVGPQVPLVTLVGSDAFWVQVAVPIDRLRWIDVPGLAGVAEGAGSLSTVVQEAGLERICRKGRVLRLLGDLDPAGRMARVLIEIKDPMLDREDTARCDGADSRGSNLPMLVGAYVTVTIDGEDVDNVVALNRDAVRNGKQVYVMNADDTLDIRDVTIAYRKPDQVLISEGLRTGDRVVTSPLPTATHGMKLRLPEAESDSSGDESGEKKPDKNTAGEPDGETGGETGDKSPGDKAPGDKAPADKDKLKDKPEDKLVDRSASSKGERDE